jgi:hypothetical protein
VDYSLELSKEGNPLSLWTMKKLAQNKFVCILLLIFFYPLGLYLVFQNEDWKRGKIFKWIATAPLIAGVLFIALTLILGFSGVLDDIPEKSVIEQKDQEEFSMSERKQIYKEILSAEDRANVEAEKLYPLDASNDMYWEDSEYLSEKYNENSSKFLEESNELMETYRIEVYEKYQLSEEQANKISTEGIQKGWIDD